MPGQFCSDDENKEIISKREKKTKIKMFFVSSLGSNEDFSKYNTTHRYGHLENLANDWLATQKDITVQDIRMNYVENDCMCMTILYNI